MVGKFGSWSLMNEHLEILDVIMFYYGEKYAFYVAWLLHYTHFLIYPSVLGLALFLYQYKTEESLNDVLETPNVLNAVLAIFIAIWSTILVESWKQKEAYLGDRWQVRG